MKDDSPSSSSNAPLSGDPSDVTDTAKHQPELIEVAPSVWVEAPGEEVTDAIEMSIPVELVDVELEDGGTMCVPRAQLDVTRSTRTTAAQERFDGQDLAAGDMVGDYSIRVKIGRGGCGAVYSAQHKSSGVMVAVKVLRPSLASSPHQVRRFIQESQALKLIDHPGIVEVYDSGYLHDGRPYFVMELLEGKSLATMINEHGRFSPAEALELLEPVCEMLELAHNAGIIHRDIKASNIMVTSGPDGRKIKLLDFGLAKLINSDQTASMQTSMGVVLGTIHSLAPEQIMTGTVDARTDVYALGALLHRLLTGRHPFEDKDNNRVVNMHLKVPAPQPSQLAPVPPAIDAVVTRAMQKDPPRRFKSAAAFIGALREAVGSRTGMIRRTGHALAIYVEGRVESGAAVDDGVLADLMVILDTAEGVLHEAGFEVLMQTTNAILGATLVYDELELSGPDTTDTTDDADDTSELAGAPGKPPAGADVPADLSGEGPGDGDDELVVGSSELDRAVVVSETLHQAIAGRADPDGRIHVNICLHRDRAVVRAWAEQVRISGGGIVDVSTWAPQQDIDGVCATRETTGAVDDERPYIPIAGAR